MKRWIVLLLAALLLCGCTAPPETPTTQSTADTATQPPVTLYAPQSYVEEYTKGAVRAYPLKQGAENSFCFMGRDILLFSQEEQVGLTTLSVLRGEALTVESTLLLDCAIYPDDPYVSVTEQGVRYYNQAENCLVVLDTQLAEEKRIMLPDDVTSGPVVNSDLSQLYYCAGNQIRVLDLKSGLSRLLKEQNCQQVELLGIHFSDTVLETFVTDDSGAYMDFVATDDGVSLGTDLYMSDFQTGGSGYLLRRLDGVVTEYLVGQTDEAPRSFRLPDGEQLFEGFSIHSLLTVQGSKASVYSLAGGERTAATELGRDITLTAAAADPGGNYVWLLGNDSEEAGGCLYRWDLTASEVSGQQSYLHPRYTAENPDTEGISRSQQAAQELGGQYGLQICVDNTITAPEGGELVWEYQGEAVQYGLAQLQAALERLPEGFLQRLYSVCGEQTIHIGLVRDITDPTGHSPEGSGGLHYVLEGRHYIALCIDSRLQSSFYHALCHVLDAYVYGESKAFDEWHKLNAEDFEYYGSYRGYETLEGHAALTGQEQAFLDTMSMTFAREDRARIFEAAMADGNGELFQLPVLQSKLQQLCLGIREAYGWEETELALPWEQYLQQAEE